MTSEGVNKLRKAANVFYDSCDYKLILCVLKELLKLSEGSWDVSDDYIFLEALKRRPNDLSKAMCVQYAIFRGDFSTVSVTDLADHSVYKILLAYRNSGWLKNLVADCSLAEREALANTMPLLVIDYYDSHFDFFNACKVALGAGEFGLANQKTAELIKRMGASFQSVLIVDIVKLWNECAPKGVSEALPRKSVSRLLCQLFQSPREPPSGIKAECARVLGKDIILLAFDQHNVAYTDLLKFSTTLFKQEVESALIDQFHPCKMGVVEWYNKNGHPHLAAQFAGANRKEFSNCDILSFTTFFFFAT